MQERVVDCDNSPSRQRPVEIIAMCVPTQNAIYQPPLIEGILVIPGSIRHGSPPIETQPRFGAIRAGLCKCSAPIFRAIEAVSSSLPQRACLRRNQM
jgi:hypothetical protein